MPYDFNIQYYSIFNFIQFHLKVNQRPSDDIDTL